LEVVGLLLSHQLTKPNEISAALPALANGSDEKSLWKIQQTLASKKYVDLTHEFGPGIPRWPAFPDETRKTIPARVVAILL